MRRNPEPDISQKLKTEKILKAVEEGSVWQITFQGTAVRMKELNAQKQEWKPEDSGIASSI